MYLCMYVGRERDRGFFVNDSYRWVVCGTKCRDDKAQEDTKAQMYMRLRKSVRDDLLDITEMHEVQPPTYIPCVS